MRSPLLEANLAALGRNLPGLADYLGAFIEGAEASDEAPRLEAVPVEGRPREPSARLPPRLGGRLVHSSRDPAGEARRLAATFPAAADTALVLGFGLGYGAEALLAGTGASRVLVCEASPSLLASALATRDLTSFLGDGRLSFLVGGSPEAVLGYLDGAGARRLSLFPNRAMEEAFPEWYGALRSAADRFASKEDINQNTLKRFGRLWVRNLAHNLPALGRLPGSGRLAGRFEGFPALVLAAGPSLDEVLPLLPALRERCLLVCVDTALRSVLRAGVEPDFLVVVDPQYWNWRHLEGLSSPSSILITESAAWPAVLRFPCRGAFLCGSLFPLGLALEAAVGAKGRLGAGGSVATTAWDFARVVGASPLYLAGLDLGYPGGKTHADASLFEQRALAAGRRLSPAESGQAAALVSAGPALARDDAGRPLRSDQRMALYAWWFESRLARPDAPPTSRLGDRGRAIPGLASLDPQVLLSLPQARPALDAVLAEVAVLTEEAEAIPALSRGLADLRSRLSGAAVLAEEALALGREARDCLAVGGRPAPGSLEALDRLDARLLGTGIGDILGFLLPPLPDLLGGGAASLEEGLAASLRLYEAILESARYHLEALPEAL